MTALANISKSVCEACALKFESIENKLPLGRGPLMMSLTSLGARGEGVKIKIKMAQILKNDIDK